MLPSPVRRWTSLLILARNSISRPLPRPYDPTHPLFRPFVLFVLWCPLDHMVVIGDAI
jgi:hypothetical protein